MVNSRYFEATHLQDIRLKLQNLDEYHWSLLHTAQFKDPTILLIISILAGVFGLDRFLLGEVGLGVAKLVTCGGFGIWHIIDWFLIMNATREKNYEKFNEIVYSGLHR